MSKQEQTENEIQREQAWDAICMQLLRFYNLEDNWDGEGSPAPIKELLDFVRKRIDTWRQEHDAPARVLITNNGDVAFEWLTGGELSGLSFSLDAEVYGKDSKTTRSLYHKERFGVNL